MTTQTVEVLDKLDGVIWLFSFYCGVAKRELSIAKLQCSVDLTLYTNATHEDYKKAVLFWLNLCASNLHFSGRVLIISVESAAQPQLGSMSLLAWLCMAICLKMYCSCMKRGRDITASTGSPYCYFTRQQKGWCFLKITLTVVMQTRGKMVTQVYHFLQTFAA